MKDDFMEFLKLFVFCCAAISVISFFAKAQTPDELCLIALANQERIKIGVKPMCFNQNLYNAAKFHSQDLADHGGNCDLHNSCDGTYWATRVAKYYGFAQALGENVATSVSDPNVIHAGWMASPGHRANILNANFIDMGAAIVLGQTNFGKLAFATEDFGSKNIACTSPVQMSVCKNIQPQPSPSPSPSPVNNGLFMTSNYFTKGSVFKLTETVACMIANNGCLPVNVTLTKVSGKSNKKTIKRVLKAPFSTEFSFNMKAEGGSVFHLDVSGNGFNFTVPNPGSH